MFRVLDEYASRRTSRVSLRGVDFSETRPAVQLTSAISFNGTALNLQSRFDTELLRNQTLEVSMTWITSRWR